MSRSFKGVDRRAIQRERKREQATRRIRQQISRAQGR